MSKLIKCKTCEAEMAADAKICPKCGAKNTQKKGCMYVIKLCGVAFIGLLVLSSILRGLSGHNPSSGTQSAGYSAGDSQPPIPEDQKRFIEIVKQGQIASKSAENDMARGGALATRNNALKSFGVDINGWVGKVTKVDSNSDGFGVLEIEIADGISIQTWNNALSDITSKTLLEPGTALFGTAASLKRGQYIKFSGQFFRDDESGLGEQSMSLRGKLDEPEFTFKFRSITKL